MKHQSRAFTIIELLVVISIIALLIGILVPAIGRAQEQAKVNTSKSNLRQIGIAHGSYAAEWSDKQFTVVVDDFSTYALNSSEAEGELLCINAYQLQLGTLFPIAWLGGRNQFIYGYASGGGSHFEPLKFLANNAFGSFRIPNYHGFNTYLNGRFYDPGFFAPNDEGVFAAVSPFFEQPDEYIPTAETGAETPMWSSYCTSPAGMFNPDVLSAKGSNDTYYNNPYSLPSGFRTPHYSQAQYPSLKTHVIEHNWNQNTRNDCSPYIGGLGGGTYLGCEPYYFNHGYLSRPVTLFYDGHVGMIGNDTAFNADRRVYAQTEHKYSLWTRDTPLGGGYTAYGNGGASGGYYIGQAGDWTDTSFHILTTFGIRGRDIVTNN